MSGRRHWLLWIRNSEGRFSRKDIGDKLKNVNINYKMYCRTSSSFIIFITSIHLIYKIKCSLISTTLLKSTMIITNTYDKEFYVVIKQ